MLNIRDISGNILLSTPANEGCKRKFTLMREDYINIKFSLDNPIYFKIGSYVDCDFGRFEVCDVQKPAYNTGTSAYDYDLRLDAYYWKWKNKIFRYTPESSGQEAAWNLTASLDVQASIIIRNLKALGYKYNGQDFTFSIDNTVDNKSRLMSYNNTSILDACFSMAEKWNCECWITDSVIHFGRCEFGDAIDFNIGVNVEDMTRSDSQTGYATRIYAFGSTRNIPSNYRSSDSSMLVNGVVQKRLMLPVGVPYIDAYPDMNTEEAIEQVVVFDNIYPRRVGTITDVSSYGHTVKNGDGTTTVETFYRFADTGINFSKDYLLDDSELRIVFQSGLLNGMDFAVKFNPNGVSEKLGNGNWNPEAQLYEIIVNEDYGRKLPDTVLKPKVGDKYILHGFDSLKIGDMSYISSAEQELKTHAEKYVAKSNTDPSTYDCRMMSDTMIDGYGNAQLYEVGQRVNLLNPAYFEDGRVSRIIGFEYNLDIPFDTPIYTVGETAAYSRIKELENKVDELVYKGQAYVGGGTGVYLITSFDRTSPSDSNTFSARRALKEFLSKTRSDRTEHSLGIGEDLTVDGNATIGKDLTVMEILRALIKIETASLNVSGNSKTGTLDVADKATARDVEVANRVTSLNAVIRALATIHNLTVENTADIMHGIIRQYLSSDKFVSGFLGEGFKVWKDASGLWHGELDMLTVRKTFTVFELVVQKVVHQGGMVIRSAAGGKITKVTDGGSYWRCEHDSSDDFVKDDQVLCQVFTGLKMKRYWRLVTSAGAGYFNLSKTDCEAGSATPEVGDDVAVLGNRTNAARQSAQIDCTVGANAPYRDDYAGINSYSLTGKLVTRTGNLSGIVDPDFGALSGFGLYTLNLIAKGMLMLTSGKTVETAIGEARSGAISAAASDAQAKANAAKAAAISAAASDAQAKAALAETNAKTHAQAIFDGLRIGGRNLVLNSARVVTGTTRYELSKSKQQLKGKTLTISFEYEYSGVSTGSVYNKARFGAELQTDMEGGGKDYHWAWVNLPLNSTGLSGRGRRESTVTIPANVTDDRDYTYLYVQVSTGSVKMWNFKIEEGTKATDWTPAPEDVEAGIAFEINKVRTDFQILDGQVTSKIAEINVKTQQAVSAAETAKANADASAAKLVAVTQKESNINQTAADIDLKAKRAEQAAGKAEAAEARVNVAADGVVVSAAKQAAQLAVDGVQVGGRNLLRNAINFRASGWNNGFSRYSSGSWTIDNTVKYNGKPTLKTLVGYGLFHPWLTLENGVEYTYSAMVRTEVDVTGTGYYPLHYLAGLNNQNQGKISVVSHDTSTVAGQWKLIRIVFKLTGDADSFRPFFYRGATGGVNYWIAWLKLEKGNKATDGSPAPEDMEADAQAKADAAKQAAISDAAAKYPTKTEYSAQLAVLNNSISSKVSQTDFSALGTRMSAAEQKITPGAINMVVKEQITTAVGNVQVGGRNYVILSKLESWIAATSVPVITDTDVNVMLKIDGTTNQQLVIRVKGYIPDAGAYYTVSGYMTLGGRPIKNADFIVKRANYALGTDNFFVDDASGYFECTHKYNGSDPWLLNAKLTAATGTPVKISKFKFEKGTKASDWTLSPEDADAALQIGGRNLYRKSTELVNLANNPTIQKEVDADSVHGFKLTGKQGLVCDVRIKNVIRENGDYVISFWGKSNYTQTPKFDICDNPCTGDATFTTEWKRFELRAKVNNYSADTYNFIDIEKLAYLHYWFRDFKVEKGTKATDWSPAPEDVQADIALRPTKEEIKAGISITTGGINVFGKEISLAGKVTFASLDAATQSVINGKATTASLTALQNRLGAMAYQNMVSLAKLDNTIVQGGYIKTSLIEARSITADKLDVGSVQAAIVTADAVNALNITAKKIQSAQGTFDRIEGVSGQDSMLLIPNMIRFKNPHTEVCFGADASPLSSGGRMATSMRIDVNRVLGSYELRANTGLHLSVEGAKSYDDWVESGNHALFIPKGRICGMRLRARRVGANTTLSVMDSIVFVVEAGATVTLPGSGVEDGQIYFIRNHCGGRCRIAGDNIRAWNDGGVGNSFEVNRGNMAILMYDATNNEWTANWTGNW
ncbi:hypothetical protein ACFX5L_09015 [Bacteroides sp. KG123]|uniref:hypothetical protein n=1 Tax=unclassified Bacteroides TaxID=2646097 RepID=UPI003D7FEF16